MLCWHIIQGRDGDTSLNVVSSLILLLGKHVKIIMQLDDVSQSM